MRDWLDLWRYSDIYKSILIFDILTLEELFNHKSSEMFEHAFDT